ncbi:VOC family protein [Thalassovita sp.]|uniref:VOC family protein n=1 Tax=Thalassovita sp. TaxID=1979401 RepID=UPI002B270A72|nr:VOC family protein [Thalassovita sp.]
MTVQLEHANFTVTDPEATAKWLCDVFGWHIRWQGTAIDDGHTIHVGSDDSYVAVYAPPVAPQKAATSRYRTIGGMNHLGVVVDDIDAIEARVKAAGFTPINHADYEPGRRFYFLDGDGIEFEVVSYA